MKSISTVVNAETYRQLEKSAAARNLTVDEAFRFISENGVAAFLALNGGVHQ